MGKKSQTFETTKLKKKKIEKKSLVYHTGLLQWAYHGMYMLMCLETWWWWLDKHETFIIEYSSFKGFCPLETN
jgi:hypothetical protein